MATARREMQPADGARLRRRIAVRGTVQGVGFRPFVYRLARSLELGGWVLNGPDGVVIEVEGDAEGVAAFAPRLRAELPPLARISALDESPAIPDGSEEFVIRISEEGSRPTALIPADVATCEACAGEVADPANRRHGYPFTNCTDCGPRFTIVESVPYDRARTTMARFEMCPNCRAEYEDPASRRFHAEPNACPVCGPGVWLQGDGRRGTGDEASGGETGRRGDGETADAAAPAARQGGPSLGRAGHVALPGATGAQDPSGGSSPVPRPPSLVPSAGPVPRPPSPVPLGSAADLLASGHVVAIKGLGGFHLACDARNRDAVRRLRAAKRRQAKPFAIMARNLEEARRHCRVSEAEERALVAPERPILLLEVREGCEIAPAVAPRQRFLGVMLPYTPLHRLLLDAAPPALVMTSGNLSEEPIAHDNDEALHRLAGMADAFLLHDRPIHTPCDDSVARVYRDRLLLLRRSRGFVPRPVTLPRSQEAVLACGGEQKNTFCLARGDEAVLSQHVGDLDNAETFDYYGRAINHFRELFRVVPDVVAHDLHPEYLSTRYATEAAQRGSRAIGVQHHHAHVASCMADNGLDGEVIGVGFDGTGYGTDGTLWGGEILAAGYAGFRRAAHLRPVRLPGGEAAIRRPARMAYAYLLDALGAEEAEPLARDLLPGLSDAERSAVAWQVSTGMNSPLTSGAGRLFDAVSAILGICDSADYEGQAATELEMAASDDPAAPYPIEVIEGDPRVLDLRPAVCALVRDRLAGEPLSALAARFHATVAEAIVGACRLVSAETRHERVCLSGGTFQNMRLLDAVVAGLERAGLQPFWHREVPPNDGGLSLGQAVVAGALLR